MDALKDRPTGLDASEILAYRIGYSKGVAKYLKDNGSPSLAGVKPQQGTAEYVEWRQKLHDRTAAYQAGVHEVAQPYAMRALTAYRKRAGIVVAPPKRAPRKVVTKVSEDDARTILIAILKAQVSGDLGEYDTALNTIMQTLKLAPAREGVKAA
jgi:hypothetical protein